MSWIFHSHLFPIYFWDCCKTFWMLLAYCRNVSCSRYCGNILSRRLFNCLFPNELESLEPYFAGETQELWFYGYVVGVNCDVFPCTLCCLTSFYFKILLLCIIQWNPDIAPRILSAQERPLAHVCCYTVLQFSATNCGVPTVARYRGYCFHLDSSFFETNRALSRAHSISKHRPPERYLSQISFGIRNE